MVRKVPESQNCLANLKKSLLDKTFAGWNTSISNCRTFESLPENAKLYCKFIEGLIALFCMWYLRDLP